jgi:hypothetical protein
MEPVHGSDRLPGVLRRAIRLAACIGLVLLAAPLRPQVAEADVGACAALVTNVSPSDLSLAYNFIKDHGECVPKLGDTTFQVITGGVAAAQQSGVVDADTCGNLLDIADSPAAQTLISVAGADIAYSNLSCACAVVNSGIAKKLEKTVRKIQDCGETFNPIDALGDGLDAAGGAIVELGEAFGFNGNGTGAAAQTFSEYACPRIGVWMSPGERSPEGFCTCPPTTTYEWGSGALEGFMRCVGACPPGEISDGKTCKPCAAGGGSSSGAGGGSWSNTPDETRTRCVKSGGGFSCGDGKIASGGQCVWACPQSQVWDKASRTCSSCPKGTVPKYVSGGGSMGVCKPCGPDQQVVGGQCQTCPTGSFVNAAGICQSGFPPPACAGETINDPANLYSCVGCPPNQKPDATHRSCVPARVTAPIKIRPRLIPLPPGPGGGMRPQPPSGGRGG